MVKHTIVGDIGDCEVTINVEGPEDTAEKIQMDLQSRAEELRQIIEEDIHPDATEQVYRIRWEDIYQEVGPDA